MARNSTARGGDILTLAFGTTTAVWAIIYVSVMPPGFVPGWLMATLVGGCLLAGGYAAGRFADRSWRGGAGVGVVVAAIGVLIMLSLISGAQPGDVEVSRLVWYLGFVAACTALMSIGAAFGRSRAVGSGESPNWLGRLAVVAFINTALMIVAGGIVTGLEAGMAIEGWLTADGHVLVLFPVANMQADVGKFAEHAHRLWGLLVGLSTIVLAVQLWRVDVRQWVRWLGVIAVIAVIVQGVLGGTRVTENSIPLAIIHGVFGQVFLGLMAALAVITSSTWIGDTQPTQRPSVATDRAFAVVLLVVLLIQSTLGALFRHLHALPEISDGARTATLHAHILGAVMVAAAVGFSGARAWGLYGHEPALRRTGKILLALLSLQLLLGITALIVMPGEVRPAGETIPALEIAITTAHQAVGALLLAMAACLFVWTRRLMTRTSAASPALRTA